MDRQFNDVTAPYLGKVTL